MPITITIGDTQIPAAPITFISHHPDTVDEAQALLAGYQRAGLRFSAGQASGGTVTWWEDEVFASKVTIFAPGSMALPEADDILEAVRAEEGAR